MLIIHIITLFTLALQVRSYEIVSDETLKNLPRPGKDEFDIHTGTILAPILQPRVPGTPGSATVRNHFVNWFKRNLPDWKLELQESTSKTPVTGSKEIPFVNIIASRDPPWAREGEVSRLTLAAHYDSKLEPKGFIGATDSAAPCAIILHALKNIDGGLTKKWETMGNESRDPFMGDDVGVQVFLLDGEEAFAHWTDSDSLYGARSLAKNLSQDINPPLSTFSNKIGAISLFVLLDLLGTPNPVIHSYFLTTHWAYQHLGDIETRLRGLGKFKSAADHPSKRTEKNPLEHSRWFSDNFIASSNIGDDHIPFMQNGVDVLHLIPFPFPRVWHKIEDNGECLDQDTMGDWSIVVSAFVAEWMELEGFLPFHNSHPTRKTEL